MDNDTDSHMSCGTQFGLRGETVGKKTMRGKTKGHFSINLYKVWNVA